jgi:aminoglycoside phosphotransferase (APT) family kinase protein
VSDGLRAVRAGEELDAAPLAAFLARAVPGWEDADAGALAVAQFGGGFSNLTYLVRAGERELVLRRPPRGVHAGTAHDVLREARLLLALRPAHARVPRVLALCDDAAVLGAPFYCMERVRGAILRGLPGEPLPDAPTMRRLSEGFVDELAALHALDWEAAGLGALGRPDGYVERQVAGWSRRWAAARTGDVPSVDAAAAWLAAHRPPGRGAALIHNDFKYDNLVLDPADPGRVVAVLDWEMATLGDPLMDLGTSLGYWVDPDDPPALRALNSWRATRVSPVATSGTRCSTTCSGCSSSPWWRSRSSPATSRGTRATRASRRWTPRCARSAGWPGAPSRSGGSTASRDAAHGRSCTMRAHRALYYRQLERSVGKTPVLTRHS